MFHQKKRHRLTTNAARAGRMARLLEGGRHGPP